MHIHRPSPFVLVSTNHGTMIVNRNDYHARGEGDVYGVGHTLLNFGSFDVEEIALLMQMAENHRRHNGDGVVVVDCGANYGVYTMDLAHLMTTWGHVYAFEAQEKIFYALAGNLVLNNCLNVTARHAAVGKEIGTLAIPEPDYNTPASYGSFELKHATTENIGQAIDYANPTKQVALVSIDSLNLPRVDILKIDVEGMEEDVLAGAMETLRRCKPIVMIEVIKSNPQKISDALLACDYKLFPAGMNLFALHANDPFIAELDRLAQSAA